MFLKIVTLLALVAGIKGADLDYIFNDQADGWLKLYKTPAIWEDANIRCETEGAVIGSPTSEKLRDAISSHVLRQGGVSAIYTGIHADFAQGDFYSHEGVPLSNMAVQLYSGTPIDYRSSESCIVWDLVGYAFLRRAKCETRFPYVCYKKRTQTELPVRAPQPEPITESGLGARDPETNPNTRPNNKPSAGQLPPDQQPSPQDLQPTSNLSPHQDTKPLTSSLQHYPSQYPQTSLHTPNQPGTNQQTYQTNNPQTQSQNLPSQQTITQVTYQGQLPQGNPQTYPQNRPDQNRLPKCSFDEVRNLLILNSKDISTIIDYLADKPSVTVLFADSVYAAQSGSLWHVEVQNNGNLQPANGQAPPVVPITHDEPHIEGNKHSAGSQGSSQVERSTSRPTNTQGSPQSYYPRPYSQTPLQSQPTPQPDHQPHNEGSFDASHGPPQDGSTPSSRPTSDDDQSRIPVQSYPSRNPTQTGYSRFLKKAGGRLKFHQQPETFDAALTRCASEGAVLASPLTTDFKDALTNYVLRKNSGQNRPFYTGIRANFSNGDYYSTEGVALTKMPVSLNPGAPVTYQSSDSCITMTTNDDIVTSVKCTDRYPYVCFKQSKLVRSCGTQDLAYKYEQSTQSCYKFQNIARTWSEAYQICNNEGGYLAILNSLKESEALKKIFAKYPSNKIAGHFKSTIYIGIRDWRDGKSWITVKGDSLQKSGYTGWAPNWPSDLNGRECGTFARSGLMYNDPCTLKLSFICEKDSEVLYDDDQNKR